MLIPVKKAINIIDGEHEGAIANVRYRSRPYEYVDLEIMLIIGKDEIELKVGFPQVMSKTSKLGQLMERFGSNLEDGSSIDPDILIGQRCRFKTFTETNSKGKFARIHPDSVIPSRGVQVKL